MKIEIRSQHFELDEEMTKRIINRVSFSLNRFGSEISHVQIRFSDVKGPKGGQDNHCLLSVKLVSSGEIVTNGKGVDLMSTLYFCLERTKRAIIRELKKKRFVPIRMNRRRKKEKFTPHPPKKNIRLGTNRLKELLKAMNGAA